MAERRMFAKSVVCFDILPDLSHGAQALYFHLNMQADDDGFIPNPKPILRQIRCTRKHLQELLDHDLIMQFDGDLTVILHWHTHNQIRKDRYKPTRFRETLARLTPDAGGVYRLSDGCHLVANLATQVREGEASPDQSSLAQSSPDEDRALTTEPPPADSPSSLIDFEKSILASYQVHGVHLQKCNYLCLNTRKNIAALQANGWTLEALENAFQLANRTPFLCGKNNKGWIANLDWLCVEDNLRKLLDGRYEASIPQPKVPYGCTGLGQEELEAIQTLLAQ